MNKRESDKNDNAFEVPRWSEILKRIPNCRSDWAQKKSLQKFAYLYGIGKMGADAVGFTIFRDDQTLTVFSYLFVVVPFVQIILMFYTLGLYAGKGEMMSKGILCTVFITGAVLSVC